jgi:hypothetical protein
MVPIAIRRSKSIGHIAPLSTEAYRDIERYGAPEQAGEHFGWFAHFATLDMPASSEWTPKTLGWEPTAPGPIEDLTNRKY